MKKNLMSVFIMALVFVNVVLSAVIMITLVPSAKKTNQLIETICTAIDLELNSGKVRNSSTIPVDQMDVVTLTGDDPVTYTLRKTDSELHVCVTTVSITLDKEHEDYQTKQPLVAERNVLLREIISNTFLKYTYEEVASTDGQEKIREQILEQMRDLFDSNFIVAVNFSDMNLQ